MQTAITCWEMIHMQHVSKASRAFNKRLIDNQEKSFVSLALVSIKKMIISLIAEYNETS